MTAQPISLAGVSSGVCLVAVWGQILCTAFIAARFFARRADLRWVALRLFGLSFLLAFAVRTVVPFGPIINSGRDLAYLDEILLAPSAAHTHLPSALYYGLRLFSDPVQALEWAQIVIGSACAGLVALLTFCLYRREAAAMIAGFLGAVFVAAARVDASPDAVTSLRFVTLLTAIAVLLYHRVPSWTRLACVGLGAIAMSYGRLESPLFAALLLIWLAADEPLRDGVARPGTRWGGWATGGSLLVVAATGMLLSRWLLVPVLALAIAWLVRRRGGWPASGRVLLLVATVALALLPRFFEVASLERETYSRFPKALMFLVGRTNLLFHPALCTPLVAILVALGLGAFRRTAPAASGYLFSVALPAYAFGLLFMGNASAIMRLQGNGLFLLFPLAGIGAGRLVEWLSGHWGTYRRWALTLAAVTLISALLPGGRTLTEATSLDQEYAFLRRLNEWVPPGSDVFLPVSREDCSLVSIPQALARRAGITPRTIDFPGLSLPAGALVFLGAGCQRFRNGEPLPGVGLRAGEVAFRGEVDPRPIRFILLALDREGYVQATFDALAVDERPQCRALRLRHGLTPYRVERLRRSSLEGHLMPREVEFGLYRVTAER